MQERPCPFCEPSSDQIFYRGRLVFGLWDGFPVSEGHALLVTRRCIPSWFDASPDEQSELLSTVAIARKEIEKRTRPHGYNIGINVGTAAGQTVPHLHVHVIPRYTGDVHDPRGGVRWVIPEKANYLAARDSAGHGSLASRAYGQAATADAGPLLSTGEAEPLWPLLEADLAKADRLDIAVAFVMPSGVERLYPHLEEHVTRGGSLRLITGDYLDICDPDALQRLLDLQMLHSREQVQLRVFVANGQSFHPKSYVLTDRAHSGVAYVGSSNLSASALESGIEWNFRVMATRDPRGFQAIREAFDALFWHPKTREIDAAWLRDYRERRRPPVARAEATADAVAEPSLPVPVPNSIQRQALDALTGTRQQGFRAGLVVLPTGLGKTWLAAFDSNRPEFRRILFVAHRAEILNQALATFRRIRPNARLGLYTGETKDAGADVLFASVQTLGNRSHLERFAPDAFDYIVIDEFHHAAAATYRRLIEHFEPRFLLGLTATPERTDGGSLLALCQENLVFRADVMQGIREELLCPFRYFGVPDEVDYTAVKWTSRWFDEEALTAAVATRRRAENALEQWKKRAGTRTLAFCISQRHADFMRDFFRESGVRCAAVHSGHTSDPRALSVEQLDAATLQVLFAVDIFNEGVDIPSVDTVMMLRPTESRIVWLQQFGRGLRRHGDKRLTVIDYIGNHRAFLLKARALLDLPTEDNRTLRAALDMVQAGRWVLPPGCDITYELEALDILRALIPPNVPDAVKSFYDDFRERNGRRPTAVETFHEGYSPGAVRREYGSWLGFVRAMGDMDDTCLNVYEASREFLDALEITGMVKSYKMIVLQALLDREAMPGAGLAIASLTEEFRRIAGRSAALTKDVTARLDNRRALRRLLEQQPIKAFTETPTGGQAPAFVYENDVLRYRGVVAEEHVEAFRQLVREIAEWRLAQYLARGKGQEASRFAMKVSHTRGRPILFLDRTRTNWIPEGWHPITVDGVQHEANFVKVAVNVMRRPGTAENVLPAILQRWFGPEAGRPGTRHTVYCEKREGSLVMTPLVTDDDNTNS